MKMFEKLLLFEKFSSPNETHSPFQRNSFVHMHSPGLFDSQVANKPIDNYHMERKPIASFIDEEKKSDEINFVMNCCHFGFPPEKNISINSSMNFDSIFRYGQHFSFGYGSHIWNDTTFSFLFRWPTDKKKTFTSLEAISLEEKKIKDFLCG